MFTAAPLLLLFAQDAQPAVARVTTAEPVVALTFDACATGKQANGFDRAVWDILKREGIPATIFVSGRWIEAHPEAARTIADDPQFELGNHSYSHPVLTGVGDARLADEIDRAEALIAGLGRRSVAFRPPAGAWDRRVLRATAVRHLPTVLWDVVSGDAGGHLSARAMIDHVTRAARPGSIVIFHINERGPRTKEALPVIIERLRARGLRFVRLGELLRLPDAHPVPPARRDVVRTRHRIPRANKAG